MTIGDDEQVLDEAKAFEMATALEAGGDEPPARDQQTEPDGKEPTADAKPDGEQQQTGETDDNRDPKTGQFKARARTEGEGKMPKQPVEKPEARNKPAEGEEQRSAEYRIPLAEHLSEREKRQSAERERDDLRSQLSQMQRQIDELRQPKEQPQEADPFADPAAFQDFRIQRALSPIEQRMEANRLATSEMLARDKFGDEAVEDAFKAMEEAMRTNPQQTGFDHQRIMASRHPYAELVKWRKGQIAAKEIGDDPAAYEKRLREKLLADPEVIKQIIEGQRAEAQQRGGNGGSDSEIDLPPSLNSQPGSGANSDRLPPINEGELLQSFFPR